MTEAEKKAKKAAYDREYRARKKAEKLASETSSTSKPEVVAIKKKETTKKEKSVVETFTETFGFPVRLYWNRNIEEENSSCARPNTELTFEKIGEVKGEDLYRVRRGKRNFFTVKSELAEK